jgi:hypothetical protein
MMPNWGNCERACRVCVQLTTLDKCLLLLRVPDLGGARGGGVLFLLCHVGSLLGLLLDLGVLGGAGLGGHGCGWVDVVGVPVGGNATDMDVVCELRCMG